MIYNIDDIQKKIPFEEMLRKSDEDHKFIFENVSDVIYVYNKDGNVVYVSPNCLIFGYSQEEILGHSILEFIHSDDILSVKEDMYRTLETGEVFPTLCRVITRGGMSFYVEEISKPVFDDNGNILYFLGVIRDVSKRREAEERLHEIQKEQERLQHSLKEKELFLKEIHHRIKNNLQVVLSLISLQAEYSGDRPISELAPEIRRRINTIALVHEKLYQSSELNVIDFQEYVKELISYIFCTYRVETEKIKLHINIKDVFLSVEKAIPCGLIINELLTNSIKYAFSEGQNGDIWIDFYSRRGNYVFSFSDNGKGLPEDIDMNNLKTMGLDLVVSFIKQIDGTMEVQRTKGTVFQFLIPCK